MGGFNILSYLKVLSGDNHLAMYVVTRVIRRSCPFCNKMGVYSELNVFSSRSKLHFIPIVAIIM